LINALEDLKVVEDGTVRNTAGTIIQYHYGEDSVDPTRSFQGEAVAMDEILAATLGRRARLEDGVGAVAGAPPVTEEEMDLLAEAQLEEEAEEEETEEFGSTEEGPDLGGE
ncbi:MAG TPA: DNA-directed RNA polymerase subunit A', partial [Thermoplasmata archaeon]|nr:DNA-directed RNA polymerase subunit A' [Thermoplasmata archaeon]